MHVNNFTDPQIITEETLTVHASQQSKINHQVAYRTQDS